MGRRRRGGPRSRGVAIVEFAIIAPLLFLLIFGLIEFGWVFYQYLDVRNGAREGARFAATADTETSTQVITETCTRMEENGDTEVTLTNVGQDFGDDATVAVHREVDTITGFLDPIIGTFLDVTSTVEFRLEQDVVWNDQGPDSC